MFLSSFRIQFSCLWISVFWPTQGTVNFHWLPICYFWISIWSILSGQVNMFPYFTFFIVYSFSLKMKNTFGKQLGMVGVWWGERKKNFFHFQDHLFVIACTSPTIGSSYFVVDQPTKMITMATYFSLLLIHNHHYCKTVKCLYLAKNFTMPTFMFITISSLDTVSIFGMVCLVLLF